MNYLIQKSNRDKDVLIFQNFKYNFKRTNANGSKYWLCRNDGCSASVLSDANENEKKISKINGKKYDENITIEELSYIVRGTHKHADYVCDTWVSYESLFPKTLWNLYGNDSCRTNNISERFKNSFVVNLILLIFFVSIY